LIKWQINKGGQKVESQLECRIKPDGQLCNNLFAVRDAISIAALLDSANAARNQIGELLLESAITSLQHAWLHTLLYNAWLYRRIEIERHRLALPS
jgi:hypothetical protein